MPLPIIDDCRTGAEALARLRRGVSWRSNLPAWVAPESLPELPEPPKPKPVVVPAPRPKPATEFTPVPMGQMARILKMAAEYFGLTPDQIRNQRRSRNLIIARQVVMYLCDQLTSKSLPEIGKFLGRDHTTILHGARQIETAVERGDKQIIAHVNILKNCLITGAPLPVRGVAPSDTKIKRYPFSHDELRIIRQMAEEGFTAKEIARATGRTEYSLDTKIRKMGIRRHNYPAVAAE